MKIVVVHTGNQPYVFQCLRQAVSAVREGTVHWIGEVADKVPSGVSYHPLSRSRSSADKFRLLYRHRSTNTPEFELFCFQRWFIVSELARSLEWVNEPILCLDSDALLYRVPQLSADVLLATCSRTGPQYSWFGNLAALERFCDFMMSAFTDPEAAEALDRFYETKESPLAYHGGNVCDMHLLGLFALELGAAYRDLENQGDDTGLVYDDNWNVLKGFDRERPDRGPKKIVWENGLPCGSQNGQSIAFGGLHFQGGAKRQMVEFLTTRRTIGEYLSVMIRKLVRMLK